MTEQATVNDALHAARRDSMQDNSTKSAKGSALDAIRAAVVLTKDAVNAVSVTAMDALRQALELINIKPETDVINPFEDLEAPIWEQEPPFELIDMAYKYCEDLTLREAGNFYHSFKYLPIEQRRAMCAIYAFCRRADDIVDGDWIDSFPGGKGQDDPEAIDYRINIEELIGFEHQGEKEVYENKMAQLFFFRKKLSTCYSDIYSTDPVFLALKDAVKTYDIPKNYFVELISGMEDDLFKNRYRNFDELYKYCYRVASVVGLMCIEIYGFKDQNAKKYAESWGIFMQLTNVMRDVGEDIARDRVYLPLDELEELGISIDELSGNVQKNLEWEKYVVSYAKRTREYLKDGRRLLSCLPRRSRYSPAAMIAFYDRILKQIVRRQGDVFSQRVKLNKFQKLWLAAAVYIRYRFLPRFLTPAWDLIATVGLLPKV